MTETDLINSLEIGEYAVDNSAHNYTIHNKRVRGFRFDVRGKNKFWWGVCPTEEEALSEAQRIARLETE